MASSQLTLTASDRDITELKAEYTRLSECPMWHTRRMNFGLHVVQALSGTQVQIPASLTTLMQLMRPLATGGVGWDGGDNDVQECYDSLTMLQERQWVQHQENEHMWLFTLYPQTYLVRWAYDQTETLRTSAQQPVYHWHYYEELLKLMSTVLACFGTTAECNAWARLCSLWDNKWTDDDLCLLALEHGEIPVCCHPYLSTFLKHSLLIQNESYYHIRRDYPQVLWQKLQSMAYIHKSEEDRICSLVQHARFACTEHSVFTHERPRTPRDQWRKNEPYLLVPEDEEPDLTEETNWEYGWDYEEARDMEFTCRRAGCAKTLVAAVDGQRLTVHGVGAHLQKSRTVDYEHDANLMQEWELPVDASLDWFLWELHWQGEFTTARMVLQSWRMQFLSRYMALAAYVPIDTAQVCIPIGKHQEEAERHTAEDKTHPPVLMKQESLPFPDQQNAHDAISLASTRVVLFDGRCGTGKSMIAIMRMTAAQGNRRILVVCPSPEEFMKELWRHTLLSRHAAVIYSSGTKVEALARAQVIICTYAILTRDEASPERQLVQRGRYDLVIYDEVHCMVGSGQAASGKWSRAYKVLTHKHMPRQILLMSATPKDIPKMEDIFSSQITVIEGETVQNLVDQHRVADVGITYIEVPAMSLQDWDLLLGEDIGSQGKSRQSKRRQRKRRQGKSRRSQDQRQDQDQSEEQDQTQDQSRIPRYLVEEYMEPLNPAKLVVLCMLIMTLISTHEHCKIMVHFQHIAQLNIVFRLLKGWWRSLNVYAYHGEMSQRERQSVDDQLSMMEHTVVVLATPVCDNSHNWPMLNFGIDAQWGYAYNAVQAEQYHGRLARVKPAPMPNIAHLYSVHSDSERCKRFVQYRQAHMLKRGYKCLLMKLYANEIRAPEQVFGVELWRDILGTIRRFYRNMSD